MILASANLESINASQNVKDVVKQLKSAKNDLASTLTRLIEKTGCTKIVREDDFEKTLIGKVTTTYKKVSSFTFTLMYGMYTNVIYIHEDNKEVAQFTLRK